MRNFKRETCLGSIVKVLFGLLILGASMYGLISIVVWAEGYLIAYEGQNPTPDSAATTEAIVSKTMIALTQFSLPNVNATFSEAQILPTNTPQPTIEIAWLNEGEWWEYAWTDFKESGGMGLDTDYSLNRGVFRITLGPPIVVSGEKLFPLHFSGDIGDFAPRWTLINVDSNGNVFGGSNQSSDLYYIFERDQSMDLGGFFASFGRRELTYTPSSQIIMGPNHNYSFDITALKVGFSDDQSNCTYFSDTGQTICVDEPDSKESWYEYWSTSFDPVPLAMYYYSSYEDCGGGFCSYAIYEQSLSLIDFSN